MSINLRDKIKVRPAELYLAIQYDRTLSICCDTLEKALQSRGLPAIRLKALSTVWIGLATGSTTPQMIEEVQEAGYGRSYAEAFVRRSIGKFRRLLEKTGNFEIKVKPLHKMKEKRWGRPEKGSRQPKTGRPPFTYHLTKLFETKPDPNMEKLRYYTTLLSGTQTRLTKLLIELMQKPEMRGIIVRAAAKMPGMPPPEQLEESYQKTMIEGKEDLIKQIESNFNQLQKQMNREILKKLKPTRKSKKSKPAKA